MEKRTVIALVVVAVLIIGTGITCYLLGRRSVKPVTVERVVHVPGKTIELPGKIKTVPVPVYDSAGIAAREAEIARLRAERDEAMHQLARYEETWVMVDTAFTEVAELLTPDDSLLAVQRFETRMQIRYGYPPANRFVVLRSEERIPIRVPMWTAGASAPPAESWLSETFGWIRDVLAVIGGAAVVGGAVYVATRYISRRPSPIISKEI